MPSQLQLLSVPLVLAALLLVVSTAQATPAGPPVVPFALEEEFEGEEDEEGEFEVGACETAAEEVEEGELGQDEADEICEEAEDSKREKHSGKKGSDPVAAEECVLRSAHGHAAVDDKSNKLKLTLGYTAYEPAAATIAIGHVAILHRQLGRSGVLRIVKALRKHQDLNRVVVDIRIPSARKAGCPSRRLVLFPG